MASPDDPLGLGIEGVGHGGYAEGFSVNGIDLRGYTIRTAAAAAATAASGGAVAASLSLGVAQRKKFVGDIVELLEKHRGALPFAHFQSLSAIDLGSAAQAQLVADLAKNAKIRLDVAKQTIAYQPKFADVRGVPDILAQVHSHPFGLAESELMDAYHGVDADIEQLVHSKQIYRIRPQTLQQQQLEQGHVLELEHGQGNAAAANNPNVVHSKRSSYSFLFPRRRAFELPMDTALIQLWRGVAVPSNSADLDDALLRAGLMTGKQRTAHDTQRSQLAAKLAQKRKKSDAAALQRKRHRMNLTNTHLLNKPEYQFLKQTARGNTTTGVTPPSAPAPAAANGAAVRS